MSSSGFTGKSPEASQSSDEKAQRDQIPASVISSNPTRRSISPDSMDSNNETATDEYSESVERCDNLDSTPTRQTNSHILKPSTGLVSYTNYDTAAALDDCNGYLETNRVFNGIKTSSSFILNDARDNNMRIEFGALSKSMYLEGAGLHTNKSGNKSSRLSSSCIGELHRDECSSSDSIDMTGASSEYVNYVDFDRNNRIANNHVRVDGDSENSGKIGATSNLEHDFKKSAGSLS